jgi:hypothetical protein
MKINKHLMSLKYLQLHTNDIAFGVMSELIFFSTFQQTNQWRTLQILSY